MLKTKRPTGEYYCPFCKGIVGGKDLMWHEGLGGNWLHVACFLEWKSGRDAHSNDRAMENLNRKIQEA